MISRRTVLMGGLALAAWPVRAKAATGELPRAAREALETSPYVYISPLRSDGQESRCHGEVWFAWLDGAVVTTTNHETWKARSLGRGLDKARLWVGDYGRWKKTVGHNEAFRKGPSLLAEVRATTDTKLLDRLLTVYDAKYPEEIERWRDRMRKGVASGERLLLRYTPVL